MELSLLTLILLGVVSLITGVVSGMGLGGGTFLIPILTIFFGFNQKIAQGINLLVFLPCAIVSLIIHFKNKFVNFKVGLLLLPSALISAGLFSYLAMLLDASKLKFLFAIFLIIIGIYQLVVAIKAFINKNKPKKTDNDNKKYTLRVFTTKMFK